MREVPATVASARTRQLQALFDEVADRFAEPVDKHAPGVKRAPRVIADKITNIAKL
jgi:hypothetical protein